MNNLSKSAIVLASPLLLAGCLENSEPAVSASPATLSVADIACLNAVRGQTNNPDAVVLESLFSEAGTQVIVGVGPERARWSCVSSNDGIVMNVQSQTNEGFL